MNWIIVCAPRTTGKANCGWLRPCNVAVIPAKAGIQALNGIARHTRDLNSYLWVADPRQVTFSCAHKRKSPKRMRPGRFAAHTPRGPLRTSLRPGASLTRRAQKTRLGLDQESRDDSRPCSVLGSLRRGWEQPTSNLHAEMFSKPRMAHPSPVRLWVCAPKGSRTGKCATGPRDRKSRWARAGTQSRGGEDKRAIRGVLSFGSFSLHEQRKGTCRGSATHK
jgi:hypothetical protein